MPEVSQSRLIPRQNCWVSHASQSSLGIVLDHKTIGDSVNVKVVWGRDQTVKWYEVEELRNGFQPGHIVQDMPKSNTRRTLGTGTVLAIRRIADRDMVQVQLHSTGESRWFPYENLIRLRDVSIKYVRAEASETDSGERFRLKVLAYALDSWNQVIPFQSEYAA